MFNTHPHHARLHVQDRQTELRRQAGAARLRRQVRERERTRRRTPR